MSREVVFVECLCSCAGLEYTLGFFLCSTCCLGRDQIEVTRCKLVGFLWCLCACTECGRYALRFLCSTGRPDVRSKLRVGKSGCFVVLCCSLFVIVSLR